jgi:hypothetical protein
MRSFADSVRDFRILVRVIDLTALYEVAVTVSFAPELAGTRIHAVPVRPIGSHGRGALVCLHKIMENHVDDLFNIF